MMIIVLTTFVYVRTAAEKKISCLKKGLIFTFMVRTAYIFYWVHEKNDSTISLEVLFLVLFYLKKVKFIGARAV